jgi:glutathione S-transferase
MSAIAFKPKAYLREGCPFSFKLLLFLAEAGISNQLKVIRCRPEAPDFEAIKAKLQAGLHNSVTFPTVEVEPDRYLSDSDALIGYFSSKHNIDVQKLPALSFYTQTIFPQLTRLHQGHSS